MYIARFLPDGGLVWGLLHNVGTEARGVARANTWSHVSPLLVGAGLLGGR